MRSLSSCKLLYAIGSKESCPNCSDLSIVCTPSIPCCKTQMAKAMKRFGKSKRGYGKETSASL